jgi:hypothetical protein
MQVEKELDMKTKKVLSISSLLLLALLAIGCGSSSFDNGVSGNPANSGQNGGQIGGGHDNPRPGDDKIPPVR